MILDAGTFELVNAIEAMLEPAPAGEIKPELMESVLEISTDPCPDVAEAGRQLRALRGQVVQTAAAKDMAIGSAGTHPFAMWEDQRIVARPRYRDLISRAAVRRPPGADLRHARSRRRRRPRQGDPRRQRHARPHPGAARTVRQLAVLARRRDRPGVDPDADLPRLPPGRDPAHLQGLGRLRAADRVHDQRRGDRGLHLPVARRAAAPELRDRRDPGDGLADPHRALARAGGARPGARQGARRALRCRRAALGATRSRCSTRTSGWPPVTASRASSSTCPSSDRVPTRALARRLLDRMREHCQDLGSAAELEAVEDLLARGNGAARQVVVYEANHDLREVMAEIVAATRV